MEVFFGILIIIGLLSWFIDIFMQPEKHKVALIVLAVLFGISAGVKDADRKRRR